MRPRQTSPTPPHNTERLDFEGTIAKIKTAEYVQLALEGREHEAVQ